MSLTLIPNPDKDVTKEKKTTDQCFMNIDAETLNKMLANKIT